MVLPRRQPACGRRDERRLSIVVLPFTNLFGDPAQDYIVDALTDELTTSLARIPSSFVIARNTAFTYKGKPVDAKGIGKDLGVRYVLEGSVQPTGTQVRVNAQLIDADSGAHVWAEQFDTARADLLQMQDEIVTHLTRTIEIQMPEAEAARLKRTPATNPTAEDLAWQCQAALFRAGFVGKEADAGFRLCEQALDVDPNNVHALNFLSFKFWLPVFFGFSADPQADLKRGDELVSQARGHQDPQDSARRSQERPTVPDDARPARRSSRALRRRPSPATCSANSSPPGESAVSTKGGRSSGAPAILRPIGPMSALPGRPLMRPFAR